MNEQQQREQRQRDLVGDALAGYRDDRIGLRRLVEDLEALTDQFELVTDAWREDFRAEVNELESIYATALYRDVADRLPDDFRDDAAAAVQRLVAMMAALDDVPKTGTCEVER
jgi:hypothetical protein